MVLQDVMFFLLLLFPLRKWVWVVREAIGAEEV